MTIDMNKNFESIERLRKAAAAIGDATRSSRSKNAAARIIEDAISTSFKKHSKNIPIPMRNLQEIIQAGRWAIKYGKDLDKAMKEAIEKFMEKK